MEIVCFHTAQGNVRVFEEALTLLAFPDVRLRHEVHPDLLERAEREGGLTEGLRQETVRALRGVGEGAQVVLLTCSTLGDALEGEAFSVPVMRVDAALAAAALAAGLDVVVLCAVGTTVGPTRRLFEGMASDGQAVSVRLVEGAWEAFRAGEIARYETLIAEAADRVFQETGGRVTIALAQASMAGAAQRVGRGGKVFTSPLAGLEAAVLAGRGV